DGNLRIWDLKDKPVALVSHYLGAGNIFNLAFSPDGQRLACCIRTGEVRVWNVRGQREMLAANVIGGTALCAAFSPDARWLATAKDDRIIRVWDIRSTGSPQTVADHVTWIKALAISPDGQSAALAGGYNWDVPPGRPTIRLVDLERNQPARDLVGHQS